MVPGDRLELPKPI